MIQLTTGAGITLLLAFAGLLFGFGKILMRQFERRIADQFKAQDRQQTLSMESIKNKQAEEAVRVAGLADEIKKLGLTLPMEYVRREDWIRFSASIDHKLDRLAELVLKQGGNRARD